MDKITIPAVYPIHKGNFVTVPAQSWKILCDALNSIVNTVNAQTETILELTKRQADALKKIEDCTSDTAKLAKIVEEIYENFE